MQSVITYSIGGLAEQLIGVFMSPLMTRLLSPDQYGVVGLIAAFFSTTALFRVAGMDSAFPYFRLRVGEPESLHIIRGTATYVATAALIITASGFLIASLTTEWLPRFFRVENPLSIILIALWLGVSGINGWYLYILRYENLPIGFIKVSLVRAFLFPLLFIPTAWMIKPDIRLTVFFIVSIVSCVASTVQGLKEIQGGTGKSLYNRKMVSGVLTKEMLGYGLVLVPSGVFYAMITVSDRYLLAWLSNTAEIGIYSLALSISSVLLMLKGWFGLGWGPYIIELIRQNPREKYEKVINRTMCYMTVILTGIAVVCGLWISDILGLIYPSSFLGASLIIPPLLMSGVVSGLSLIANVSVVISQIKKYHFYIYGLSLLLNIIVCIVLIPLFGGAGAAMGMLIAEMFILSAWIVVTNHLTDAITLNVLKPAIVFVVFSLFLVLHLAIGLSWVARLMGTLAILFYGLKQPESIRTLAWGRQVLWKRGGRGDV